MGPRLPLCAGALRALAPGRTALRPCRDSWAARGLRSSNPFTRRQEEEWRRRNRTVLTYIAAAAVGMVGMSYAAVPLYRLYCQVAPRAPGITPPSPARPRRAPGGAERGLSASVSAGDGAGRNHGRGARRGAAGENAARAAAPAEGDVQRGRARRAAVELPAPAERDLRELRRVCPAWGRPGSGSQPCRTRSCRSRGVCLARLTAPFGHREGLLRGALMQPCAHSSVCSPCG